MSLVDILQCAALVLLPVGIALVCIAIWGLMVGIGCAAIVSAPELWFVGRELDLRGGE